LSDAPAATSDDAPAPVERASTDQQSRRWRSAWRSGHHGGGGSAAGGHHETEVEVTAGEAVVFEPGGNHVMLEGLAASLERGDRFALTLDLATGEDVVVDVVVADNPPT